MMCYRDRTFCGFCNTCKYGKECYRALTPEVIKGARKEGLPISQFSDIPDCYEEDYVYS